MIYRLMRYKGSNLLVVRAVMNTHRDSTFAQLSWAQEKLGVAHLWQNTVSPMEMTYLPTGQKILFRGFDDVLKLASTTVKNGYLCFVWVEEAYEIGSAEDFLKLDLSVPRGCLPPHLFKQTTITFNPWSETHWLKSRFFDNTPENAKTFTTTYLCNEFLDETDKAVFEEMKAKNYSRYRVAGLGEWGVSEGLIYENFSEGVIDITAENGHLWHNFFGLDYGYSSDPTAFIALSANVKEKIIYIFDEFYERRMLNCDIAEKIKQMGYAKERIRADSAEPKSNDDLRRMGITRIMPSVKGADSIINGIMAISEFKIIVNPKCKNTLAELNSYVWVSGKNVPEDRNNHLMDALRYAFYDVKQSMHKKKTAKSGEINAEILSADINGGW